MSTLDLAAAAKLLKVHPKTLQAMARAGCVPACKVGRAWSSSRPCCWIT